MEEVQRLDRLADQLAADKRGAEALLAARKSLEIAERHLGGEHMLTVNAMTQVADLLVFNYQFKEAKPALDRAISATERAYGASHANTAYLRYRAAFALSEMGDLEQAEAQCRKAIRIYDACFGADSPRSAAAFCTLAGVLQRSGNLEHALAAYSIAINKQRAQSGLDSVDFSIVLSDAAGALRESGRLKEAKNYLEASLEIKVKAKADDGLVADTLHSLALVEQDMGLYPEAEKHLRAALVGYRKAGVESRIPYIMTDLGVFAFGAKKYKEAVEYLSAGISALDKIGDKSVEAKDAVNNLGIALQKVGDLKGAEKALRRAVEMASGIFGPKHASVAVAMANLGDVMREDGRTEEADAIIGEAVSMLEACGDPLRDKLAWALETHLLVVGPRGVKAVRILEHLVKIYGEAGRGDLLNDTKNRLRSAAM